MKPNFKVIDGVPITGIPGISKTVIMGETNSVFRVIIKSRSYPINPSLQQGKRNDHLSEFLIAPFSYRTLIFLSHTYMLSFQGLKYGFLSSFLPRNKANKKRYWLYCDMSLFSMEPVSYTSD